MSRPEVAVNSARLNEISSEQMKVRERLDKLYADWERISEEIESFKRG